MRSPTHPFRARKARTREAMRLGSIVEWTSSSAGVTRTKRGEIVEVVMANWRPVHRGDGWGIPRRHESYVVRAVAFRNGAWQLGSAKLYWPRVSQLKEVKP